MKKLIISSIILLFSIPSFAQNSREQLLGLKSNLSIDTEIVHSLLPNETFRKKSRGLAVLYSLLMPGMGELYADNYSTGKYFTIADGIIWGVLSGFVIYGNNKEDDYKAYAQAYGHVNTNNKDDNYFGDIGVYENIDQFNTEKELNREFSAVYNVNSHYWSWADRSERKGYRAIWLSSENAKNNVRFAVGALFLNRVVSAIFAVRSVNAYNRRESSTMSWNVNFSVNQIQYTENQLVMNLRFGL